MRKIDRFAVISIAVFMIFSVVSSASADGLDTLIDVGRSQGEIAKAYAEETRAYESVKRATEGGQIAKGMSKKAVTDRYGEPVVAVGDYGTSREKWIYKPASSDFSKGPKVILFFTKEGVLDEISVEK